MKKHEKEIATGNGCSADGWSGIQFVFKEFGWLITNLVDQTLDDVLFFHILNDLRQYSFSFIYRNSYTTDIPDVKKCVDCMCGT